VEMHDIIIRPLITEKITGLTETGNQYGFIVNRRANKVEIKKAIEKKFEVKITSVRTLNVKGKVKRLGRFSGKRAAWKKAMVTLAEGNKITLFEGA
jgi:large subunit ribosomal protein L23